MPVYSLFQILLKRSQIVGELLQNNARQAIDALLVAEASLNEIASLSQRLEELGALYNNNTLLSTTDMASLNAETAKISNIDSIVSVLLLMVFPC